MSTASMDRDYVIAKNSNINKKSETREDHGNPKTRPFSETKAKTKKPRLPLYGVLRSSQGGRAPKLTVDDILKEVKCLDDGAVSPSTKPSFEEINTRQFRPSSHLKDGEDEARAAAALVMMSPPEKFNVSGDSEIVSFKSLLVPRPDEYQEDHENPSSLKQNTQFSAEANAALTVLDVSDFRTCTKSIPTKRQLLPDLPKDDEPHCSDSTMLPLANLCENSSPHSKTLSGHGSAPSLHEGNSAVSSATGVDMASDECYSRSSQGKVHPSIDVKPLFTPQKALCSESDSVASQPCKVPDPPETVASQDSTAPSHSRLMTVIPSRKPHLDSFLDGDADLFEKLQTPPPKCIPNPQSNSQKMSERTQNHIPDDGEEVQNHINERPTSPALNVWPKRKVASGDTGSKWDPIEHYLDDSKNETGKNGHVSCESPNGREIALSEAGSEKTTKTISNGEQAELEPTPQLLAHLSKPSNLISFPSVSGRKVALSKASVHKASKLLIDVEQTYCKPRQRLTHPTTPNDPIAFTSTNGSEVAPCKASMESAYEMLSEEEQLDIEPGEQLTLPTTPNDVTAFTNANGCKVAPSKASIEAAFKVLNNVEQTGRKPGQHLTPPTTPNDPIAFKPVGGSKVAPSKASANKMLSQVEQFDIEPGKRITMPPTPNDLIAFTSARGGKVDLRKASMERANKMLSELEQLDVEPGQRLTLPTMPNDSIAITSSNGGKVAPSTASIESANKMLIQVEQFDVEPGQHLTLPTISNGPIAFTSARGGKVAPSKASMERANKVLSEVEQLDFEPGQWHTLPTISNDPIALTSANGRKEAPSKASIEAAFSDGKETDCKPGQRLTPTTPNDPISFTSAGGVALSEANMERANKMLREVEQLDAGPEQQLTLPTTSYDLVDFTSVNGCKVASSKAGVELDIEHNDGRSFSSSVTPLQSPCRDLNWWKNQSQQSFNSVVALRRTYQPELSDDGTECDMDLEELTDHPAQTCESTAGSPPFHGFDSSDRSVQISETSRQRLSMFVAQMEKDSVEFQMAVLHGYSSINEVDELEDGKHGEGFCNDDRPLSPVLNLTCDRLPSLKMNGFRDRPPSRESNVSRNCSSSQELNVSRCRSPGPELNITSKSVTINGGGTGSGSPPPKSGGAVIPEADLIEWEDFPELKPSQAAFLEQSGSKKENLPSAANQASFADAAAKSTKPPTPSHSKPVHYSTTPLSSRNPLSLVTAKRKSLPSVETVTKKRKTEDTVFDEARAGMKACQAQIIASKKNHIVVHCDGILKRKKKVKSATFQLTDLPNDPIQVEDPLQVTSENAVHFRIRTHSGKMADNFLMVGSEDGTAGLEEVVDAFLTSPRVDPQLVPSGWVKNHYRWIVWKLASYDRSFPEVFEGKCLTVENVLMQLKYRYDREIVEVKRPAFRMLLEGDAPPNKFICCLASVKQNRLDEGESLLEFELTDGWYSIWAVIDSEMVALYEHGKVRIGTKLMVHGAEITGKGCDPLNVPASVRLRISTNSVRRVRWHAKLGFTKSRGPFPTLLSDVLPGGGAVGRLKAVIVVRKYPFTYMYKDKETDEKAVFRSERAQERLEKQQSIQAEAVYEKLWKEVEAKYRNRNKSSKLYSAKEIETIHDPEILYSIFESDGGEAMQSQLSADQLEAVFKYRDEVVLKIRNEVMKEMHRQHTEMTKKVTKLLKVRIRDFLDDKQAILTIWRPTEEHDAISENCVYDFTNIVTKGMRNNILQLSSTNSTTYEPNPTAQKRMTTTFERVVTPLRTVSSPDFSPTFGELDTAGVVVLVKPGQRNGLTVVYLSDLEGHFLSITFWTSLGVLGYDDLMTEGSIIACSNLQWRAISSQWKIPSAFVSEFTSFSHSPRSQHLNRYVDEMKSSLAGKDVGYLVSQAKTHIAQIIKSRDAAVGSPAVQSPATSTPARSTPGRTPRAPSSANLRGQARLDEAPPLTPMPLTVFTRHVFRSFKSPCVTPKGN